MGTPYMGEIKIISWNYAPKGWSFCNGQTLPINQNQALFSLFGTMYGGNGQTTFALPNLQGRVPVHMGADFTLGEAGGEVSHTLTMAEMPAHNHFVQSDTKTAATSNNSAPAANEVFGLALGVPSSGSNFAVSPYGAGNPGNVLAPASVSNYGGSQPHSNQQPYLVLNFIVALQGVFPSRN
jgi:microcystin-dependent protein